MKEAASKPAPLHTALYSLVLIAIAWHRLRLRPAERRRASGLSSAASFASFAQIN